MRSLGENQVLQSEFAFQKQYTFFVPFKIHGILLNLHEKRNRIRIEEERLFFNHRSELKIMQKAIGTIRRGMNCFARGFVEQKLEHAIPFIIYLVAYMLWFKLLEDIPRARYHDLASFIDRMIPFVEELTKSFASFETLISFGNSYFPSIIF